MPRPLAAILVATLASARPLCGAADASEPDAPAPEAPRPEEPAPDAPAPDAPAPDAPAPEAPEPEAPEPEDPEARPREEGPRWSTSAARQEAVRVSEGLVQLLRSSERGDPRPAAAALGDPSWIVRRAAALRLGVLGLPPSRVAELREAARPGSAPLRRGSPARAAARALGARPPEREPEPAPELGRSEALRLAASLISRYVAEGKERPLARRELLGGLLAYRAASADPRDRGFLAQVLGERLDLALVLSELGLQEPKELAEGGGRALFRWFEANAAYLYWQPRARRFELDSAARRARQPSEAYRERHPWPEGQGPRRPAPRPVR